VVVEQPAGFGQSDLLAALEQKDAQLRFELLHLHRDGGLRVIQFLRRPMKASAFHDRLERF